MYSMHTYLNISTRPLFTATSQTDDNPPTINDPATITQITAANIRQACNHNNFITNFLMEFI